MAIHNIKMKKKNKTDWDILYPLTLASNVTASSGKTVQYELDTMFDKTATTTKNGAMSSADKSKLDGIEANANRYVHPNNASTRHVTDAQISLWNDKYTKLEIDNKFNELNTGLDWKESVSTFNDIATIYPKPQDGWTVNTKDTDITYRYTGTAWIAISANAIPLASQSVDGKMSKTDKKNLDTLSIKVADLEEQMNSLNDDITSDLTGLISRVGTAEKNITTITGQVSSLEKGKSDINHNHDSVYSKSGHTHNYAGSSSAGGAANSAVKLTTARTINGVAFDGTANITVTDSSKVAPTGTIVANRIAVFNDTTGKVIKDSGFTIATSVPANAKFTDTNTWRGVQDNLTSTAVDQSLSANQGRVLKGLIDGKAASSHTHNYLSLSGGKINMDAYYGVVIQRNHATNGSAIAFSNTTGQFGGIGFQTDKFVISSGTNTNGDLLTINSTDAVFTGKNVSANKFIGALSGNATTATTLQTARTINGTSFNGSANITTANWGTTRTITIGNTGKSVNGSANISWTLGEIGAAPSNHNHDSVYQKIADSWKVEPKKLAKDTDLNTLYTSGVYSSDSDGNATTIKNRPPGSQGFIVVVYEIYGSGVAGRQVQVAYMRGNQGVYMRDKAENAEWTTWVKLYTSVTKPTAADVGALASGGTAVNASKLNNKAESSAATANTIVSRDSSGDVVARLLRTSYADQSNISGAIAFRINNSTDNYTRYCNNPSAIRTWLGALSLSGGTMTGALSSSVTSSTYLDANKGKAIINSTAAGTAYNMLAKMNSTNGVWTMGSYGAEFFLNYTANSTISAGTNAVTKKISLFNESGNTSFPGTVTAPTFSGALSGNSKTATTLQTARTINGTSFNGSANITTANWGTARTITIGGTGKSVNGSANVTWSLAEIGALGKTEKAESAKTADAVAWANVTGKPSSFYTHPTTAGNKHIPTGGASGQILKWSASGTAVWAAEKSYSVATQSANGLMSSADKKKLDGLSASSSSTAAVKYHIKPSVNGITLQLPSGYTVENCVIIAMYGYSSSLGSLMAPVYYPYTDFGLGPVAPSAPGRPSPNNQVWLRIDNVDIYEGDYLIIFQKITPVTSGVVVS